MLNQQNRTVLPQPESADNSSQELIMPGSQPPDLKLSSMASRKSTDNNMPPHIESDPHSKESMAETHKKASTNNYKLPSFKAQNLGA